MSPSDNVITTLRDRLALAAQVEALAHVHSEQAFLQAARRVAEGGDQVIPVLLRSLPNAGPRELNVLGVVASMYPHRTEILNKLYTVAADVERTDRERVSAMLILERFLDQEPDATLLHTLDDPRAVAIESVKDLIRASEQEPSVLIQYTRALSEQPADAVSGVIETLLEVTGERAVPVLRLIAQAQDGATSAQALHALGRVRHLSAVHALQSVLPMLPAVRRPLAERSLRKLQFGGLPVESLPAAGAAWRSLVSTIDGEGQQVVWFIRDPDPDGSCAFIGLVTTEEAGIAHAYGNHAVPVAALPQRRGEGHIHQVPLQIAAPAASQSGAGPENAVMFMLEAELDYGRQLVRPAQAQHLERGQPLPEVYRLLGPLIWQYAFTPSATDRHRPDAEAPALDLLPETGSLPYHPYFRGWFEHGEQIEEIAQALVESSFASEREVVHAWATRLAADASTVSGRERLQVRLRAMEEWLRRAREDPLARLASVAAQTVDQLPPQQHPLIVSMVELGLDIAMHTLH